ncbi:hypothetical protein NQ176_g8030 [Zarea fungicola]|uniref:Uncharacterized protein n=1 Tax=Zarea fungicola TaxID=93591 RepID=A0ACC1MWL6_9HYPO|nr:hypothetical protein NQ176_g8030 [Lecanicillium fungicola]
MRNTAAQVALAFVGITSGGGADTNSSYHDNAGVLNHVNPLIGTRGFTPNDNGGMIPSVAPPFAMTRWTPQTRENYISQVPYSDHDHRMHGFQATHQPAIWMGESGQVVITPGTGDVVQPAFERRGLSFRKEEERSTAYVYQVLLDADSVADAGWNLTEQWASDTLGSECPPCPGGAGGVPDTVQEGAGGKVRRDAAAEMPSNLLDERVLLNSVAEATTKVYQRAIRVAMSASAHVGHLRFDFEGKDAQRPHVTIQASRLNWTGSVEIDADKSEISGSNSQRQDWALGSDKPDSFRGYFVSRFSEPFTSYGVTQGAKVISGTTKLDGKDVGAYAIFGNATKRVETSRFPTARLLKRQ